MTEVREHTFPFAGTETVEGLPTTEGASQGGRNRTALIAAVVAGALVLAGAAYFLFLSGGSSSDTSGAPLVHVAKPKVSTPKTGTVAKPVAPTGTKAYTKVVGKDPFKALVQASTTSGSGTGTTSTSTGTTSSSTSSTSTTGSTATTSTTGSTTGSTGTTTGTTAARSSSPISLTLLSVRSNNTSASLTVNGTKATVAVGATFATYFRVMALWDGKCGTFQYGDEAFNLCAGHSIRLQ